MIEIKKDYSDLHRGLVLKYYWQVIKRFKISFAITILGIVVASGLDIYIPLQFLKLWKVLSANDFSVADQAQNIIIIIFKNS